MAHNVGITSHVVHIKSLLVPGLIFPGHETINCSRMPPSYKNPLPHPYSFLKGPLLSKNAQSAPPSLEDPLSLENIMIVLSYTPSSFSFLMISPTCRSSKVIIAACVARG